MGGKQENEKKKRIKEDNMVDVCITGCALTSEYAQWIPIVAIAIALSFLIISVIYMLAKILRKIEWEALAKTELYQTVVALIWVIIIAAFATASCTASCQVTNNDNPFTTAINYLNDEQAILAERISSLQEIAKNIRIQTALMYTVGTGQVMPYSGCGSISQNFETLAMMLGPFIGSLIFQMFALTFIQNIAFSLLLPIGIILKILPFTREAGAFVIAIAVSLYIILPLMFVFAEKATAAVENQFNINVTPEYSLLEGCVKIDSAFSIYEAIGHVMPAAVFFPALAMIVTIAAARVLSKVFMYDFMEMF